LVAVTEGLAKLSAKGTSCRLYAPNAMEDKTKQERERSILKIESVFIFTHLS
jgi:hypothetical protein